MTPDFQATWYHGSPLRLTALRVGSTITQDRHLAEVFSHKPAIVSISDDGQIKHNGDQQGWLYRLAEEISPEYICPVPNSSMAPGAEWLTNRELDVELLGPVEICEQELLTEAEIAELYARQSGTLSE